MRAGGRDNGMTVIELMIAMMIMVLITVPLVTSFVLGLRTTQEGRQDTDVSVGAQLLAAFFDVDVAGSGTVSVTPSGCGDGGASVLELSWTDGGQHRAAYRVKDDPEMLAEIRRTQPSFVGPVSQLVRVKCSPGSGLVESLIARGVLGTPQIACDGTVAGSCAGKTSPRTVSIKIEQYTAAFVDTANVGRASDDAARNRVSFAITAMRKVTS